VAAINSSPRTIGVSSTHCDDGDRPRAWRKTPCPTVRAPKSTEDIK
jgi:hypothetical protein